MIDGVLHINGIPCKMKRVEDFVRISPYGYEERIPRFLETLPNGVSHHVLDRDPDYPGWDNTQEFIVPAGHYFMMGDNRHNSEDSRYWGYVPEDHIVGKPVFIWMSWDSNGKGINKIRWDRLFTTVNGEGQPQSYFKYFLFLLALYFVGDYFWKKRKASKV
jgi:signal peptidase I